MMVLKVSAEQGSGFGRLMISMTDDSTACTLQSVHCVTAHEVRAANRTIFRVTSRTSSRVKATLPHTVHAGRDI